MKRAFPLLSIVALTLTLSPTNLFAEDALRGISVTGECLKKVSQDRGAVTVSSTLVALTPREASERVIQSHEKVKSQILALKLDNMVAETANYSVAHECTYNSKSERSCSGYRATLSTRFETSDIASLGEIISVASTHGAQDVSDLETFVSPARMKTEREGCLETATQNAKAKAMRLAFGAGVKLGKLISLNESVDGFSPHPLQARGYGAAMAAEGMSKAAPTIDTKPVDLTVSVSALYGIE
jgi:uncharacterized protein YggE